VTDSRLIIMRHAKSDWKSGTITDFDRPLSTRGKREGRLMAKWLARPQLAPDLMLSSPALRARQTAELVANEIIGAKDQIKWLDKVYAASLKNLLDVIEANSNDIDMLMLIGHNPGLDELLCFLSKTEPVTTAKGKLMTTASIAVLNYGSGKIVSTARSASLELFMRPKQLDFHME
jgi:phosphohistidine phosphatase